MTLDKHSFMSFIVVSPSKILPKETYILSSIPTNSFFSVFRIITESSISISSLKFLYL